MDYFASLFKNDSPRILLCRHGEGAHLTGDPFDMRIGPSLTGKKLKGEWTGGKGQAFRRISRQLVDSKIHLDYILVSPQMRALETAGFARLNDRPLVNGKPLANVPIRVMRNCYEQTKCLHGQGNIIPPLSLLSSWPNASILKRDRGLWSAIQKTLSKRPRQPASDGRSASGRAKAILEFIEKNFSKNHTVLIIAHDGILRDLIYARHKKRSEIFDLCEIRPLDSYSSSKRKTLMKPH